MPDNVNPSVSLTEEEARRQASHNLFFATTADEAIAALDAGADVNARDADGTTALSHHAFNGSTEIVKLLIDRDAEVDAQDGRGYTALRNAVEMKHADTVKALLDSGADPRIRSFIGDSPLDFERSAFYVFDRDDKKTKAAAEITVMLKEAYLRRLRDVVPSTHGMNDEQLLQEFIAQCHELSRVRNTDNAAYFKAFLKDYEEAHNNTEARRLTVFEELREGSPAFAVSFSATDHREYQVESNKFGLKFKPVGEDAWKYSASFSWRKVYDHIYSYRGWMDHNKPEEREKIISVFTKVLAYTDKNFPDAMDPELKNIIRTYRDTNNLVEYMEQSEARYKDAPRLFYYLAESGRGYMIEGTAAGLVFYPLGRQDELDLRSVSERELFKWGEVFNRIHMQFHGLDKDFTADLEKEQLNERLMITTNPALAKNCLMQGADVNFIHSDGWTPLTFGAFSGHSPEHMQMLIDAGADVHYRNKYGRTALHECARHGDDGTPRRIEVAKRLLAAGAEVDAKDNKGCTAADLAEELGNHAMATFLKDYQRRKEYSMAEQVNTNDTPSGKPPILKALKEYIAQRYEAHIKRKKEGISDAFAVEQGTGRSGQVSNLEEVMFRTYEYVNKEVLPEGRVTTFAKLLEGDVQRQSANAFGGGTTANSFAASDEKNYVVDFDGFAPGLTITIDLPEDSEEWNSTTSIGMAAVPWDNVYGYISEVVREYEQKQEQERTADTPSPAASTAEKEKEAQEQAKEAVPAATVGKKGCPDIGKQQDDFFKKLYEDIMNNNATWQKGWVAGTRNLQHNPLTGTVYSGINALMLASAADSRGFNDPRWLTFNQLSSRGYKLRTGAKGVPIVKVIYPGQDSTTIKLENTKEYELTGNDDTYEEVKGTGDEIKRPRVMRSIVYNGSLIEGIPLWGAKDMPNVEIFNEYAEKVLAHSGVEIVNQNSKSAYYDPKEDKIVLPLKEQFKSANEYYQVALHELAHSTGAAHRLNRDQSGKYGSEAYAKEELVAEISSYLLSMATGVGTDSEEIRKMWEQDGAYIKSWLSALPVDEREKELRSAFHAAYEVQKVLTKGLEQELNLIPDRLPSLDETRAENFMAMKKRFEPKQGIDIMGKFLCVDQEHDLALQGVYKGGSLAYLIEHKISNLDLVPNIRDHATVNYDKETGIGKVHVHTPEELKQLAEKEKEKKKTWSKSSSKPRSTGSKSTPRTRSSRGSADIPF